MCSDMKLYIVFLLPPAHFLSFPARDVFLMIFQVQQGSECCGDWCRPPLLMSVVRGTGLTLFAWDWSRVIDPSPRTIYSNHAASQPVLTPHPLTSSPHQMDTHWLIRLTGPRCRISMKGWTALGMETRITLSSDPVSKPDPRYGSIRITRSACWGCSALVVDALYRMSLYTAVRKKTTKLFL